MRFVAPLRHVSARVGLLAAVLVAVAGHAPCARAASLHFTPINLGNLGLPSSQVDANLGRHVINDSGEVVGTSASPQGSRAFLWTQSAGMTSLGTLGGSYSSASGINEVGQVVGSSTTASGTFHAFVWSPGVGMIDLGGLTSYGFAISDSGEVVGQAVMPSSDPNLHAFLWTLQEGMIDLGTLGGATSKPVAVNDHGQVVGSSYTADGHQHAFSWTKAGGMVDLTPDAIGDTSAYAVNDSGVVAGTTSFSFGSMAFVWTEESGLRGVGGSGAYALNENGDVAGYSQQGPGLRFPFVWLQGSQISVPLNGFAYGLNDAGQVVGTSGAPPGPAGLQGFSWTQSSGVTFLPTPVGYSSSTAVGVSNRGLIVGNIYTSRGLLGAVVWIPSDTTPPTLTVPTEVTAEATSAAGAEVAFVVTAYDDVDGSVAATCSPASGSVFALGETVVTCNATDSAGNAGSASFTVYVRDTTPPVLQLPPDKVADATGPGGAAVSYAATATDTVDPSPAVTCTPPSGSTFAIGATTVNCTATDSSGNSAHGSFTITAKSASEQLVDLADAVVGVGPGTSLLDKLADAQATLSNGDTPGTCSILNAFINETRAQSDKTIPADQAAALIAGALRIKTVLGCTR